MQPPGPQPFDRIQQQLAVQWQAFYARPDLRLCRWLAAPADQPLLHAYLQGLATQDVSPLWVSGPAVWPAEPPAAPHPVVTWLPQLPANAEHLLRQELTQGGHQRFIVLEDAEQQPLRRLARWYPALVQTVAPDASMARLLREMHEQDQQNTPETPEEHLRHQYQQQFRQLTEALALTDDRAVAARAAACQSTCQAALQLLANTSQPPEFLASHQRQALSWLSAEIGVWLMVAPYHLGRRQPEQALAQYQLALNSSEAAYAGSFPELGIFSVHAWLGQTVAWQQRRQWDAAAEAARAALARAEVLQATQLAAEAARQLGQVLDRAGQHRAAGLAYGQALDLAERLPPTQRPAALVQEAGEACLKRLHTATDRKALRTRLQLLC